MRSSKFSLIANRILENIFSRITIFKNEFVPYQMSIVKRVDSKEVLDGSELVVCTGFFYGCRLHPRS